MQKTKKYKVAFCSKREGTKAIILAEELFSLANCAMMESTKACLVYRGFDRDLLPRKDKRMIKQNDKCEYIIVEAL